MVTPTPTAGPLTAAITGLSDLKMRSVSSPPPSRIDSSLQSISASRFEVARLGASPGCAVRSKVLPPEDKSAPAQKPRPDPVTMIARILSSASALSKASIISVIISRVKALSFSGRLSVIVRMLSATSYRIVWYAMPLATPFISRVLQPSVPHFLSQSGREDARYPASFRIFKRGRAPHARSCPRTS